MIKIISGNKLAGTPFWGAIFNLNYPGLRLACPGLQAHTPIRGCFLARLYLLPGSLKVSYFKGDKSRKLMPSLETRFFSGPKNFWNFKEEYCLILDDSFQPRSGLTFGHLQMSECQA